MTYIRTAWMGIQRRVYDPKTHGALRFDMISGMMLRALSVVGLLGISVGMGAQHKAPTLGEVLQRLEANLNRSDADVPSFFCEEHIVSLRTEPLGPPISPKGVICRANANGVFCP